MKLLLEKEVALMNRKKVDYTRFAVNPSETLLRQVFFKDQDLRFIWFIINDEHPITIPQLTRIFNKTYSTTHDRVWFYQKLNKVQNFGIFEKKPYMDCKENGTSIELEIIKKHREWLLDQPEQFHNRYNRVNAYLYLTDKGLAWTDEVEQMQKRYQ